MTCRSAVVTLLARRGGAPQDANLMVVRRVRGGSHDLARDGWPHLLGGASSSVSLHLIKSLVLKLLAEE